METKICIKCGIEKPETAYYRTKKGVLKSYCKECVKDAVNKTRQKIKDIDGFEVLDEPNTYINKQQKKDLFELLTALGWFYNGKKWYKPGVINEDGSTGNK